MIKVKTHYRNKMTKALKLFDFIFCKTLHGFVGVGYKNEILRM